MRKRLDSVAQPDNVVFQPFHGGESKLGPVTRSPAGVKESRRSVAAVRKRRDEDAQLVDQTLFEKRTVDSSAAFEQQPANAELCAQFAKRAFQVDPRFSGE